MTTFVRDNQSLFYLTFKETKVERSTTANWECDSSYNEEILPGSVGGESRLDFSPLA